MHVLNNKKGETLVEVIIGVVLLAIASIMLVNGFVSTANIVNRATLYKNASSVSSSSIELQELQPTTDNDVNISLTRGDGSLVIKGTKSNGSPVNFSVNGEFIVGKDEGKTELTYREFLSGTYDFYVPAEEIGE